MRNTVNNLKKRAKEIFLNNLITFENTFIEFSNLNPKAYRQLLRHFIKTNKKSEVISPPSPPKSVKENGEVTFAFSDVEKAYFLKLLT